MSKKEQLPDEYIPTHRRPEEPERRAECTYAIGRCTSIVPSTVSCGMTHGPNSGLKNMLEVDPTDEGPIGRGETVILWRFNVDGTNEPLYQWVKDRWKKYGAAK